MYFSKYLIIFLISIYIFGCAEKTTYYGKVITQNDLNNNTLIDRNDLIENFGQPSFYDNLQRKVFYYTEMSKSKNFFDQKTEYSYLFVFELDNNDIIIGSETINLLENKNSKYRKTITENDVINRGLIEKIFGGVGPNKLPNSP